MKDFQLRIEIMMKINLFLVIVKRELIIIKIYLHLKM